MTSTNTKFPRKKTHKQTDAACFPEFEKPENHFTHKNGAIGVRVTRVIALMVPRGFTRSHVDKSARRWKRNKNVARTVDTGGSKISFPVTVSANTLPDPSRNDAAGEFETVALLPDLHTPYDNSRILSPAAECVFRFLEDRNADKIVFPGDLCNCSSVNHHDKKRLLLREGLRLEYDYHSICTTLDRARAITPNVTYIEGNHDAWITQYIEQNPEQAGRMEIPVVCDLEARGVEWVEENKHITIGKLNIKHGNRYGVYAAKHTLDDFGDNIFFCHTHGINVSVKQCDSKNGPIVGANIGCLCDMDSKYRKNQRGRWQHGFAYIYVHRETGTFFYYIPQLIDNAFVWNGKTYQGD